MVIRQKEDSKLVIRRIFNKKKLIQRSTTPAKADRIQEKIMEDKKEAQIKAGQDAKLLLENPQMIAAFNTVLNGGYQQWISTDIKDTEGREALYHKQRAILEVKNTLVQTIENGQILEEERKGGK